SRRIICCFSRSSYFLRPLSPSMQCAARSAPPFLTQNNPCSRNGPEAENVATLQSPIPEKAQHEPTRIYIRAARSPLYGWIGQALGPALSMTGTLPKMGSEGQ